MEVVMKLPRSCVLSGAVLVLAALCDSASAQSECSAAMLKGAYAFSAQGEITGLIDNDGGPHVFAKPSMLNDVAIITFNGVRMLTRTDSGNTDGVPRSAGFNTGETGSYTVNADCTGTMTIYPASGVELDLKMVIAEDGAVIKALIAKETVPGSAPAQDKTECNGHCGQLVQVTLDGRRVSVERLGRPGDGH
jgi:hypothetical protein